MIQDSWTPLESAHRSAAKAFDSLAPRYDALYGPQANNVMDWLRQRSLECLRSTFPEGSLLLEVGCGSGTEAVALACENRRVVVTDISAMMLATALSKADSAGVRDRVEGHCVPASHLGDLVETYGPGHFDGAYSSFGVLNCEPDLASVAAAVTALLAPGASLVLSVMNRWCLFEVLWFLVHGRWSEATRRLRKGSVSARLPSPRGMDPEPPPIAVRYYSPREFLRPWQPTFKVDRVEALGLLVPPPYLDGLYNRFGAFFSLAGKVERRLAGLFPAYWLGDHFLVRLRLDPQ